MEKGALNSQLKICKLGQNKPISFAAEELKKYLVQMSVSVAAVENPLEYEAENNGLWLGTFDNFKGSLNEADDEIFIDVQNGKGIISGSNPRSVLLGVYRFLYEVGCRWVRPGIDGEFIPSVYISDLNAKIVEKASYRHRGICIEGACSYENVRDIIDWAPKVGFNSYFFQFREAFTFFDHWYTHVNNPLKSPEPFTVDKAREFIKKAEDEIERRGIVYHAVGHGWTCEPLGIPALGWESLEYKLPPDKSELLALVNGKREIWKGVALNTNLCYFNPDAKKLMVDNITEYLKAHSNVDVLHFWLADDSNNQCECENCVKANPSDFYVDILNELDDDLTKNGITTKVVFLVYVDLLWAPLYKTIKNPDRFILMFAPITRTYSSSFNTNEEIPNPAPYVRNKSKFPSSVKENLAYLKSWQKIFNGDSFDFDYHFMWDHYNDPGYYNIAQIINEDMKNLEKIGLNGYISCQTQRAYFPTGLGMYTMGRTLWNNSLAFDDIAEDYFKSAFGADGGLVLDYLKRLSELFDPTYLRGERQWVDPEAANRFSKIPKVVDEFLPIIQKNKNNLDRCRAKSWVYLELHTVICKLLSSALEAKASDNYKELTILWDKIEKFLQENEDEVQPVLDVFLFINTLKAKLLKV